MDVRHGRGGLGGRDRAEPLGKQRLLGKTGPGGAYGAVGWARFWEERASRMCDG